jgi:hypothetical protein
MTNEAHDDPERDAWLSEALRHAPDAQAAPPPALSEAILRQARAATAAPARAAERVHPTGVWAAAWAWLARPPVAAGFASVMVATLVGLLWWDQPLDATRMTPPASETRETPAAPSSPAPTAAPPPAPASPAAPADMATNRERAANAERSVAVEKRRAAPKPAPPPAFARQRQHEAAPAVSDNTSAARAETRALASGALARDAAKAAAPRREGDAAPARPAALSTLLASVAAQPERWSWQRGGALQPMTPALQHWLVQLDAATATHWRSAAEPAPADPGSVLHLSRDDARPAAMLRLTDDAVWFAPASRAELPRAAIDALKQALDEATR